MEIKNKIVNVQDLDFVTDYVLSKIKNKVDISDIIDYNNIIFNDDVVLNDVSDVTVSLLNNYVGDVNSDSKLMAFVSSDLISEPYACCPYFSEEDSKFHIKYKVDGDMYDISMTLTPTTDADSCLFGMSCTDSDIHNLQANIKLVQQNGGIKIKKSVIDLDGLSVEGGDSDIFIIHGGSGFVDGGNSYEESWSDILEAISNKKMIFLQTPYTKSFGVMTMYTPDKMEFVFEDGGDYGIQHIYQVDSTSYKRIGGRENITYELSESGNPSYPTIITKYGIPLLDDVPTMQKHIINKKYVDDIKDEYILSLSNTIANETVVCDTTDMVGTIEYDGLIPSFYRGDEYTVKFGDETWTIVCDKNGVLEQTVLTSPVIGDPTQTDYTFKMSGNELVVSVKENGSLIDFGGKDLKIERNSVLDDDGNPIMKYVFNPANIPNDVVRYSDDVYVKKEDYTGGTGGGDFSGDYNDLTNKPTIPSKTSQLVNDSKYQTDEQVLNSINSVISSVYKYVGSVADIDALNDITDANTGDVYNVESDGMNYAWTGTAWDSLGNTIDLTEYAKKTDLIKNLRDGSSASSLISSSSEMESDIYKIGKCSVSLGFKTKCSGNYSVVFGSNNNVNGNNSVAFGSQNNVNGNNSVAFGVNNAANGNCSYVGGLHTVASGESQTAYGRANIEDTESKYIEIVGNGSVDGTITRSNARTLDWDGNMWVAGKYSQDGTPTEDTDLATVKYVNDAVASGSGSGSVDLTGYMDKETYISKLSVYIVNDTITCSAMENSGVTPYVFEDNVPSFNVGETYNVVIGTECDVSATCEKTNELLISYNKSSYEKVSFTFNILDSTLNIKSNIATQVGDSSIEIDYYNFGTINFKIKNNAIDETCDVINNNYIDSSIWMKKSDSSIVHKVGDENIDGKKVFENAMAKSIPTSFTTSVTNTTLASYGWVNNRLKNYVGTTGSQTVGGIKTFSSIPKTTATPSGDTDLATVKYVNDAVASGSGSTPTESDIMIVNYDGTTISKTYDEISQAVSDGKIVIFNSPNVFPFGSCVIGLLMAGTIINVDFSIHSITINEDNTVTIDTDTVIVSRTGSDGLAPNFKVYPNPKQPQEIATKDYVDKLIGDIQDALDSIIGG